MSFQYTTQLINSAFNYKSYRQQIADELAKPPADEAALKMRSYTQRNVDLMDKYDRDYKLSDQLKAALEHAPATTWLVLTEGWCGDAAFNVPMFSVIEKALPGKVQLRILLRDSNLELMDAHLTDGGRSIPKLIILNEDLHELGTWGPRPDALQDLMKSWKSEGLGLKEIIPMVHKWYNEDDTVSLQNELIRLVNSYS